MLDLPTGCAPFDGPLAKKSYRRAVQRAHTILGRRLGKLKQAMVNGDDDAEAALLSRLLDSPKAKLAAYDHLARRGKLSPVADLASAKQLLTEITVFESSPEEAIIFAKKKTSGTGYRTIFDFGPCQKIGQRVISYALSAYYRPRHFQLSDRGVPKAIKNVLNRINDGQCWVAHCDIRDFYPSFELPKLVEFLPLPKEVVESALTGRSMVLNAPSLPAGYPHSILHFTEEARQGLPQGHLSRQWSHTRL